MRREYFSFTPETNQFDKALTALIENTSREERKKIIPSENVMRYSHGIKLLSVSSEGSDEESEMEIHSAETIINMSDIREHNLSALPSFLRDIIGKMNDSFQKMMYRTVSEACDKSGNIINAKEHEGSSDVFLATLKKIEFGVGRDGKVSLPEFHVGPGVYEKLRREAESKGQNFKNEVDKVIEEKSKAALEREENRLARFVTQ